jgi:hypothetical protein
MVSLFTIVLGLAALYWLFGMGGWNTITSLVSGNNSQQSSNVQSNVSADGKSVQRISQSGQNISSGVNAAAIKNRVDEMMRAQGIDMSQPNINIQKTDDKGNRFNVQKDSRFANATSFFVNSGNNRIRAF